MNTKNSFKLFAMLFVAWSVVTVISCKKDEDKREPPVIELESGTGLTNADATVAQGDSIHVGVHVERTEDELNTFDVSVFYDGSTSSSTSIHNEVLSGTESDDGFDRDVDFAVRSQAGTEKYVFTVTDKDGNIAQASFTLTVQ
jgi:hypothetical protein